MRNYGLHNILTIVEKKSRKFIRDNFKLDSQMVRLRLISLSFSLTKKNIDKIMKRQERRQELRERITEQAKS